MSFQMPVMDPCDFCELARPGAPPWNLLARDDLTMTVLNGRQYEEVPHFHVHVVPRSSGSDWGLAPPHFAKVQAGNRPPHLDHALVTGEKSRRVRALARWLTPEGR